MAWIPQALHFLATVIEEPLQYSFMKHALMASIIVGVLCAVSNAEMSVNVCTKGRFESELGSLLAIRPSEPLKPLTGLNSVLRDYQTRGVEWLLFLYDNHFGGLLCDQEMGLGKTHQSIGAICAIAEQRNGNGLTLVVCPTTVIGHWIELLRRFAPEITFIEYYRI